jgi:hypothetical protein
VLTQKGAGRGLCNRRHLDVLSVWTFSPSRLARTAAVRTDGSRSR